MGSCRPVRIVVNPGRTPCRVRSGSRPPENVAAGPLNPFRRFSILSPLEALRTTRSRWHPGVFLSMRNYEHIEK